MIAEIIGVGTELLMGQIANTNAQFISGKLQELGINVYYHTVVGDNPDRLKDTLRRAIDRSDIVITTGGLGPTKDDLTKETIAEYFGKPLVSDKDTEFKLISFFKKIDKEMTPNNMKQAFMPKGCKIVPNDYGTAPGCILEESEKIVILLPGPPMENVPMFIDSVIPFLRTISDSKIVSRYVKVFGIGESSAESLLMDLIDGQNDPTIAPYAKTGETTFRVTTSVKEGENADDKLLPFIDVLRDRLGDKIYSIDDETLAEVAAKKLMETNTTISIAESCTGGLISSMLTDIPGVSAIFDRGIITYSDEAKIGELGVSKETLEMYGAVSNEVAEEMAEGIRKASGSDIAVSVTGIAGPGGGTEFKPVGLIYIGYSDKNTTESYKYNIAGKRDWVRYVTALYVFDLIRKKL